MEKFDLSYQEIETKILEKKDSDRIYLVYMWIKQGKINRKYFKKLIEKGIFSEFGEK